MSDQLNMQFAKDKTVIVTGAAGFVASHLVEALLDAGAFVIGVDNFLTGRMKNVAEIRKHGRADRFEFIEADVCQPPSQYFPQRLTDQRAPSPLAAIFHLASPASPPRYQAHPIETYQVNAFATHSLLEWMQQYAPQARFIFASTSEIYGDPSVHPQPETYWGNVNPNGIRSCYDEAKRLGETICGVFERDFGLDVRIMRIFNTYGPRMDPSDGRVIPNFVSQVLAHEPMTIYGEGMQTRSYCYVADLVDGIMRLAAVRDGKGLTCNLGNPEEYTIRQTAELVYEVMTGSQVTTDQLDMKPLPGDDPQRRRPDIELAMEKLNWAPKTDFKTGLEATVDYFRLNE